MPWRRGWTRHGFLSARSAGKPWVSEMEPLQVSMAERTNRRKHWGNPVILQQWATINTQSRGRKPLLSLKSILRAGKGVHTTQNYCSCAPLFFCTYNGVFAFSFSAFSIQIFFPAMNSTERLFLDCWVYFLYIFQMFRESWRPMNFHSMRSMDQGMDGACWSVVNYW